MKQAHILRIVGVFAVLILGGCSDEIDPPDGLSSLPPQPETPRGLTASIGDGSVTLTWTVNRPAEISRYMVYYSDLSDSDVVVLDSSQTALYYADGLANGRLYYFRVSAVTTDGLEGEPSSAVTARPGIFSILIENGAIYASRRDIRIGITAPRETELVQLSENEQFTGAHWVSSGPVVDFLLSDGDGAKRVYARFQLSEGGSSIGQISDSIILDRYALIDSVTENSGGAELQAGDTLRFSAYTSESGGEGEVTVVGLATISLNDRGWNGDRVAGDGVYELLYTIPIGVDISEAEVTGRFIDGAGNRAADVVARTRININNPPGPVYLTGYPNSSFEVDLSWTTAADDDFAYYRIFRNTQGGVDTGDYLVATISNPTTAGYRDTTLDESTAYYYRLFVYDARGGTTGSNEISAVTPANQPPASITIAVSLTGDPLSTQVSWQESPDADFRGYYVLRDYSPPTVYNSSLTVHIISDRATTAVTDFVPMTGIYYYRIFVLDRQGAMTGSNTVSVAVP